MTNNLQVITQDIQGCKNNFLAVAANKEINFEREAEFAIQIISDNDYLMKLALSNRQALIDAVTNVAAIGISLNPAKKQAYLVPRKNKICLDISYMGLVDLAVGGKSIMWAHAALVHSNDEFKSQGFDKAPLHNFNPFDEGRGEIVGVYAVVKTASGDFLTTTMPIKEVYDIRDRSEAYKAVLSKKAKSCPWTTDAGEMIKKTAIKRGYKYWPRVPTLDAAIQYLNTVGGEGLAIEPKISEVVQELIEKVKSTTTDKAALDCWNSLKSQLSGKDYDDFKKATAEHRAAIIAKDESRTIDEVPSATIKPKGKIPEECDLIVADLISGGVDLLSHAFSGLSKSTYDKLAPFYAELVQMAQQKESEKVAA